MYYKLALILGVCTLHVNSAAIAKRPDIVSASASLSASSEKSPIVDYHANREFVPYQRLKDDMTVMDEDDVEHLNGEEEQEEEGIAELEALEQEGMDRHHHHHALDMDQSINGNKYGVTNVGSRQHRYRDSVSAFNFNPILVVPMKPSLNIRPKRRQKSLIGLDDHGHMRHVMLDSNKNENGIEEKSVVAADDHGNLHTMVLPMTMLPGPR